LDDSIKLWLFPRTLIGNAAKWFIELPSAAFFDFQSLAIAFLTHFQLPIRYEMGTELLTSLRQNTATHISDHIHEWRRRRRLVKAPILDALLADWFTKSLLPKISCDVAMSKVVTEEDVIRRAQHLDLIYSQSGTLYDIIPNAPQPSNDQPRTTLGPHANGMIGSIFATSVIQVARQLSQLALIDKHVASSSAITSSVPVPSTDVKMVQTSKPSRCKNENQRWKESSGEQEEATPKETPSGKNKKGKKKLKFPCLACKEDHFTKDCLHLADVQKFVE